MGNNRFGQLGAWQVSLFRDSIASNSGLVRGGFGGGGGGGYANSAMGPAASAPVFSTASPDGIPRCVCRTCLRVCVEGWRGERWMLVLPFVSVDFGS